MRDIKARMRPLFTQERVAASAGLFLGRLWSRVTGTPFWSLMRPDFSSRAKPPVASPGNIRGLRARSRTVRSAYLPPMSHATAMPLSTGRSICRRPGRTIRPGWPRLICLRELLLRPIRRRPSKRYQGSWWPAATYPLVHSGNPPHRQSTFHIFGALAEFERSLIRERTTPRRCVAQFPRLSPRAALMRIQACGRRSCLWAMGSSKPTRARLSPIPMSNGNISWSTCKNLLGTIPRTPSRSTIHHFRSWPGVSFGGRSAYRVLR